ncbi:MAG: molybdopterin-dependent oxidoreductase, partial [Planctomycetaceae bacterium]
MQHDEPTSANELPVADCTSCGCPTDTPAESTGEASSKPAKNRRGFLALGAALLTSGLSGCGKKKAQEKAKAKAGSGQSKALPASQTERPKQGIDLEKWNRIKGEPYEEGAFKGMPGVCKLPGPNAKRNWPDRDKYKNTTLVPGMCQLCSTVCGIMGHVKDGRLIKIEGNPNDPNSRGHLCARGHAGLNHQYHPERLLYPLKRVGERGEGKWKRISWDEALNEIAEKLKKIREEDKHEEFAFHQGRQRSKDCIGRFVKAFGTPTQLSHRSLCSGNRRAANLTFLWESDWDLNDVEHSKYILNFGSNALEAHQGHVSFATRIQKGRFENGAKMVTFDVRLSNTAGASDEWFAPFPGTDGAIALAMSQAILEAGLHSEDFINNCTNVSVDELKDHLKENTPEWAEKVSGVPAVDIRRIALEFAKAAPTATTMCNRGSSAHLNGFYNDRAIQMLNAVVGSVGKKGGWCWSPWGGVDPQFKSPAAPPSVKDKHSILEDPPEYPLANVWRRMRVGEIIYLYLVQGRAKLQAYMTYNLDSPLTWPEESLTQEVLSNEELINFHVCINCFYNETAHYADIVLPWATYMERWDLEARGAYNLRPYVGLRTPMVEPLGEAKDIREFFPMLARKIGGGMEEHYKFDNVEDYMREWAKDIPKNEKTGKSGLDRLLEEGCYEDTSREPFYEPFAKELTAEELAGSNIEDLRASQASHQPQGASPGSVLGASEP